MSDQLSMVLCSGTEEKLKAASVIAGGAVALGTEVSVLLQFSALDAFRASRLAPDDAPAWAETFRQSKAMGTLTINACSASMDELGLEPADLDPVVDGVSGIAAFLIGAGDGQLLFI